MIRVFSALFYQYTSGSNLRQVSLSEMYGSFVWVKDEIAKQIELLCKYI